MSLITRCPACGTMFKVVPDQLRISEGWVRCGHCAEVFDAMTHLQKREPAAPAPAPATPAQVESAGERRDEPASGSRRSPASEIEAWPAQDDAFAAPRRDDAVSAPGMPSSMSPDSPETEPGLDEISFVVEARRAALWQRPAVRALLLVSMVVLVGLLGVQVALHDRDRLAATETALKPWLQRLCAPLRCAVTPLRQIDAIVVDSSSFNKLRSDAYRLAFTLKNQAATEVAMPAIELTLTDSQDQPVLRRVLLPADLGASSAVIAAASEWSASLAISVGAAGSVGRITGYRVLAFYP